VIHKTDHHELRMAFFDDPDGNALAVMSEVPLVQTDQAVGLREGPDELANVIVPKRQARTLPDRGEALPADERRKFVPERSRKSARKLVRSVFHIR
jgi:hypothetical protein